MNNTDLHTHSYFSDGTISPKQLVRLAKKKRIRNLALTDHDSVKGVKEAVKEGKKIGVNVIPAVEIRCDKSEVLGYFISINNKDLIKKLEKSSKRNEKRIKKWCSDLKKAGYDITFSELWKKYPKARGNINEFYPLWELHLKGYGSTLSLSKKLRKKVPKKAKRRFSIIRAIKIIKKAKGVPVLAHPWLDPEVLREKDFKKYIKSGLRGIEINNGDRAPFLSSKLKKKIKKLAKKYKLIITSGSDYHGPQVIKQMPGNHELGKNNCSERIVYELKKLRNFQG